MVGVVVRYPFASLSFRKDSQMEAEKKPRRNCCSARVAGVFFLLLSIDFLKSDFVVVRVVALSFPRLILLKRISSAEIRDIFNEPTIYSRIRNRLFSLFSLAFSKLSSKLTVCLLWKKQNHYIANNHFRSPVFFVCVCFF